MSVVKEGKKNMKRYFFGENPFLKMIYWHSIFFDFLPFPKKFLFCVLLLSHPISGSASVILELCCCGSNLS
jgi:hypothetical protein